MKRSFFIKHIFLGVVVTICLFHGSVYAMGNDHKEAPSADKNAEKTLKHLSYAFEFRDESAFFEMTDKKLSDVLASSEQMPYLFKHFKRIQLNISVDEKIEHPEEVRFQTHWYRSMENVQSGKVQVDEGRCLLIFRKSRKAELVQVIGQNPFVNNQEVDVVWK